MQFTKLKKRKRKKKKKKSYLALFLDGKMQKKTHFGNICALDLKFYSITLKLGSQLHKEVFSN